MELSSPNVNKTKLTKIFTIQTIRNSEKPGRSIAVIWDTLKPLIEGFENNYSYIVTLQEKGNIAANHYHEEKQELIYPIAGNFTVAMENIKTKEREEILIEAVKHQAIHFPTKIAHAVRAETNNAVFLVIATSAGTKEDMIRYEVL